MLILYAHGSSDERWLLPFRALLEDSRSRTAGGHVALAFAEFALPSLREVVKSSFKTGERLFTILPLYVVSGAHLSEDLPQEIAALQKVLHGAVFEVLPSLSEIPEIRESLLTVIESKTRNAGGL